MSTDYEGRQFVGINLHRRRSVIVRMTETGEKLEGGERQGVRYAPVLRDEPTGRGEMTWGEVVEARYLRAYRQKSVSMQQLRPVIAALRHEFAVPYPLAHFKPFVDSGRAAAAGGPEPRRAP